MNHHLLAVIVWALAQVEAPQGIAATTVGPAGETGGWQLTPAVRHDRGAELHRWGIAQPTDEQVARAQVSWLYRQFRRHEVEPTVTQLAEAWNAGFTRTLNGQAPARAKDFGERVSNLVEEAK